MELNIENRIKQLSEEIVKSPQDDALYYERGKLYWKAGMRAEAITDFNQAVSLNAGSPAADYLKMVNEILDFYNTDLYNP
ncbi:MAG: hypothetical protein K1V80_05615 [Muribaculaceae bacterium]